MLYFEYDGYYAISQDKKYRLNYYVKENILPHIENYAFWWFAVDGIIWAKIAIQWINLPEDYKEERRQNMAEWMDMKEDMLALFSF